MFKSLIKWFGIGILINLHLWIFVSATLRIPSFMPVYREEITKIQINHPTSARTKRSGTQDGSHLLPQNLVLSFTLGDKNVTLHLVKNRKLKKPVPVYTSFSDESIQPHRVTSMKHVGAYYHDKNKTVNLHLECMSNSTSTCTHYKVFGSFEHDGEEQFIEPSIQPLDLGDACGLHRIVHPMPPTKEFTFDHISFKKGFGFGKKRGHGRKQLSKSNIRNKFDTKMPSHKRIPPHFHDVNSSQLKSTNDLPNRSIQIFFPKGKLNVPLSPPSVNGKFSKDLAHKIRQKLHDLHQRLKTSQGLEQPHFPKQKFDIQKHAPSMPTWPKNIPDVSKNEGQQPGNRHSPVVDPDAGFNLPLRQSIVSNSGTVDNKVPSNNFNPKSFVDSSSRANLPIKSQTSNHTDSTVSESQSHSHDFSNNGSSRKNLIPKHKRQPLKVISPSTAVLPSNTGSDDADSSTIFRLPTKPESSGNADSTKMSPLPTNLKSSGIADSPKISPLQTKLETSGIADLPKISSLQTYLESFGIADLPKISPLPTDIEMPGNVDSTKMSTLPTNQESSDIQDSPKISHLPPNIESSATTDSSDISRLPTHLDSSGSTESSNIPRLPSHLESSGSTDSSDISRLPTHLESSGSTDSSNISPLPKHLESSGSTDSSDISRLPTHLEGSGSTDSSDISRLPTHLESSGSTDSSNISPLPSHLESSKNVGSSTHSGLPKHRDGLRNIHSSAIPASPIHPATFDHSAFLNSLSPKQPDISTNADSSTILSPPPSSRNTDTSLISDVPLLSRSSVDTDTSSIVSLPLNPMKPSQFNPENDISKGTESKVFYPKSKIKGIRHFGKFADFIDGEQNADSRRRKRATGRYKIEVFVVVDYSIYQFWLKEESYDDNLAMQKIRQYYIFLIHGVDYRYSKITASYKLEVTLVGIYVSKSRSDLTYIADHTSCSGNSPCKLSANKALNDVRAWLKKKRIPQHDHVMTFTRHDMLSSSSDTSGTAYLNSICTSRSHSIVEEKFDMIASTVAAHEIGHALGAVHDGDNNGCSKTPRYIMVSVSSAMEKPYHRSPWKFSKCSVKEIGLYIDELNRKKKRSHCLRKTRRSGRTYDVSSQTKLGQTYNIDQQCKFIVGKDSYACRTFIGNGNIEGVCTGLWCKTATKFSSTCLLALPAEGTSCGPNKWCRGYECVYDSRAPGGKGAKVAKDCVFGDSPGIIIKGLTCIRLINREPYQCYSASVSENCCSSCNKIKSSDSNCPYGDRSLDCPEVIRTNQCSRFRKECCKSCSGRS